MAADNFGNQYLIAITLTNLERLKELGDEIQRVQRLSAEGANFKVNIDAKALDRIEESLTARVNSAVKGIRKEQANAGGVNTAGMNATDAAAVRGMGRLLEDLHTSINNMNSGIRELKNALRNQPAGGGGGSFAGPVYAGPIAPPNASELVNASMGNLDKVFEDLGDKIASKLRSTFKQLPEMLDIDKLLEKSEKWREAKQAGLSKPFSKDEVGLREAFGIYRDRHAPAQQRVIAERRIQEEYGRLQETMIRERRSSESLIKKREQAEKYLEEMALQGARPAKPRVTFQQLEAKMAELVATDPVQYKDMAKVDIKRVARRAIIDAQPTKSVPDALAIKKRVQDLLQEDKIDMGSLGGVMQGGWAVGARKSLKDLKVLLREIAAGDIKGDTNAILSDFRQNPILSELLKDVRGSKSASKGLGRIAESEEFIRNQANLFQTLRPAKRGNSPSKSPIELLTSGNDADVKKLQRALRRGWAFKEFGEGERNLIEASLSRLEVMQGEATSPSAVERISKKRDKLNTIWNRGGEYFFTGSTGNLPFKGFDRLKKVIGDLDIKAGDLTPEGAAQLEQLMSGAGVRWRQGRVPLPASGGGTGLNFGIGASAPADFEKIAQAMNAIAAMDLKGVTTNIEGLTRTFRRVRDEIGRGDPRIWGIVYNREKEQHKVAAHERNVEAREQKALSEVFVKDEAEKSKQRTISRRTQGQRLVNRERYEDREAERSAKLQQEKFKVQREKLRKEIALLGISSKGTTPANIMGALAQQGIEATDSFFGKDYIRDAINRNLRYIGGAQGRARRERYEIDVLRGAGLSSGQAEKRLLNSNIGLDVSQMEMMRHVSMASKVLPHVFEDYDKPIQKYRDSVSERLAEQDTFAKAQKRLRQIDARMDHPSTHPDYLANLWQEKMKISQDLHARGWGTEEKFYAKMNDRRMVEDALANSITKRAEQDVKALDPVVKQANAVEFLTGKLKAMAAYMGLGAVVYGVSMGINNAMRNVTDLEAAMSRIQGVLEGKSLSEQLEIKQGVIDSAVRYGIAMKDAMGMATTFAQTGEGPRQIVSDTRAAMAGVTGLGLTPQQSVELIIATQNLSKGLVQGEEIMDRISAIESRHAVTAQDLSEGIQRTGAIAQQFQPQRLGAVDAFDTVIGATTKIVEGTRVSGNQAATALRFMIARLAAPEVERNLQTQFGVRLATSQNGHELRPLQDIFGEIAQRYKELKNPDQPGGPRTVEAAKLLTTFAGARQVNAAAALLDNWDEALKISTDSALAFGDAQRRVAIQMNTWQSRMTQFSDSLVIFMDSLLQKTGLLDLGKSALKGGASLLKGAAENPAETLLGLGAGVTAFSALLGAPSVIAGIGRAKRFDRPISLEKGETRLTENLVNAAKPGLLGNLPIKFAKKIDSIDPKSVGGSLLSNLGTLGAMFAGIAEWAAIITTVVGGTMWVMQLINSERQKRKLQELRYLPEEVDQKALYESDRFKEYNNKATDYRQAPGDLMMNVLRANQEAQAVVSAKLGGNLFTTDDAKRTYNQNAAKTFEQEYVRILQDKVPALREVNDETEKTNQALSLLKESMIRVSAASSVLQSQLVNKMKEESERVHGAFQDAAADKKIYRSLNDVASFDNALTNRRQYVLPWQGNEFWDPKKGPGLSYNAVIAQAAGSNNRVADYWKIMNNIGPGMGWALGNTALSTGAGPQAFFTVVDGLVKSGKTLGQALDKVAEEYLTVLPITKDMTKAQQESTMALNARNVANREGMVQNTAARLAGQFSFTNWKDMAKKLATYTTTGEVGGGFFEEVNQSIEATARQRLVDELKNFDSPEAKAAVASLKADQAAGNRPAGRSSILQLGRGTFRDRILDTLIRYGTTEAENNAMRDRLGDITGFDFADARRSNARSLVQGVEGAVAETKGDLLRAYGALHARQMAHPELNAQTRGYMGDILEEGGKFYMDGATKELLSGKGPFDYEGEIGGKDPLANLEERLKSAQQAMSAIKSNSTLFSGISGEYRDQLISLVGGPGDKATQDDKLAWWAKSLTTLQKIRDFAKQQAADAEKAYFDQQSSLKLVEREYDVRRDMLAVEQERAQLRRQAITQQIAITGAPGEDLAYAQMDIIARIAEQQKTARLEAEGEYASNARRSELGLIGPDEYKFLNEQTAATEKRKSVAAVERANLDQEKLLIDRQNELLRAQDESARNTVRTVTSGLRDALSKPFSEGFGGKRSEWISRLLGPAAAGMQDRMANNFVDSLFGPDGVFGDKMESMFSNGAMMEYELILRAHEEGAVVLQNAIEAGMASFNTSMAGLGIQQVRENPFRNVRAKGSALPSPVNVHQAFPDYFPDRHALAPESYIPMTVPGMKVVGPGMLGPQAAKLPAQEIDLHQTFPDLFPALSAKSPSVTAPTAAGLPLVIAPIGSLPGMSTTATRAASVSTAAPTAAGFPAIFATGAVPGMSVAAQRNIITATASAADIGVSPGSFSGLPGLQSMVSGMTIDPVTAALLPAVNPVVGDLPGISLTKAGTPSLNAGHITVAKLKAASTAINKATTAENVKAAGDMAKKVAETVKASGATSTKAVPSAYSLFATGNKTLGTRFEMGGSQPGQALDCSGFIQYVFGSLGIPLPHSAAELARAGKAITNLADMKAGDVMLFATDDPKKGIIDHSAIYAGNGAIMQASGSGNTVRYDKLDGRYGKVLLSSLVSVRRILPEGAPGQDQAFWKDPIKPYVMEGKSIRENILGEGAGRFTDAQVMKAMRQRTHEEELVLPSKQGWAFVDDFKKHGWSLDTKIAPGMLSDEERRRLLIARQSLNLNGYLPRTMYSDRVATLFDDAEFHPFGPFRFGQKWPWEVGLGGASGRSLAPRFKSTSRPFAAGVQYENDVTIEKLLAAGARLSDPSNLYLTPGALTHSSLLLSGMTTPDGGLDQRAVPFQPTTADNMGTRLAVASATPQPKQLQKFDIPALGASPLPLIYRSSNPQGDLLKMELHDLKVQQAKMYAGQTAGSMLGAALNSGTSMNLFGWRFRMGAAKGQNFGQDGASLGAAYGPQFATWAAGQMFGSRIGSSVGGMVGGPLGALAFGVLGGMIGGLFKHRQQQTPEYQALEKIERNTRETINAIANQPQMMNLDNRLLNVPSTFRIPQYSILAGGGAPGGSVEHNYEININVNGAVNPSATASAVTNKLREELRGQGSYVSPRGTRQ